MPKLPSQQTPTRKRLNLDLSSIAYEQLQELSEETGKNMTEVLRTGLALYAMAHDASKKGQSMGIVEGDKVIQAIVIAL
jgi:acetyl-CoA carboxylase beta subunit